MCCKTQEEIFIVKLTRKCPMCALFVFQHMPGPPIWVLAFIHCVATSEKKFVYSGFMYVRRKFFQQTMDFKVIFCTKILVHRGRF